MSRKAILIYWLLLLLPTALIATAAYQLLRHEQERISQESRSSARVRARGIGETLQLSVASVEKELSQALWTIPDHALADTLTLWEARNPLIRNAFIWEPARGLSKPRPGTIATSEERRFIARYGALFSGRVPWTVAGKRTDNAPAASRLAGSEDAGDGSRKIGLVKNSTASPSSRRLLLDMVHEKTAAPSLKQPDTPSNRQAATGWIPWFAENRLYILGWIRKTPDSAIYGVELEVMTLLSRLILDFPPASGVPLDRVYALVDGAGEILHHAGLTPVETGRSPEISVSLAPQLPHWQVAVFFPEDGSSTAPAQGFLLLSGLLLAIFVSAIILGGALLTWQALRFRKDARRKTNFVSNVSHELKTPLTSIRMYAELLHENRVTSPEKKKQYLQVIVGETRRLTRLVNNALDFSRLEQGRKTYDIAPLNMSRFLPDLLEAQRLQLEQNGLVPNLVLPDGEPVAQVDRDAVEQVMLNLLDNAVKYAADGGELIVVLDTRKTRCRIRVMDRGPGVPRAHHQKIFDKFHRVDDSLTAVKPGSGLGLSIAGRLVTDLGGELGFEPRQGGGSVFTVLLPT